MNRENLKSCVVWKPCLIVVGDGERRSTSQDGNLAGVACLEGLAKKDCVVSPDILDGLCLSKTQRQKCLEAESI